MENYFLNNTAVLLVDLNLYANYAAQLIHGPNSQATPVDLSKPVVLLVDYRVRSCFFEAGNYFKIFKTLF
jgi:hypothetical protein